MKRRGWIQARFSFALAGLFGALALCAFVFASCEELADAETPATEWYVSLPTSDGTASSADWTQADVVRYVVRLLQGGTEVMQKDGYPGERVLLNQLAPGEYNIVVEGYNDVDEVIADGGGTVYLETGKIANVSITLTMRTNRHSYSVVYDTNAGSDDVAGDLPQRAAYNYHDEVTVAFPTLTRTGYDFDGWNTQADGTGTAFRADGTTAFTVTTYDVTLYAQWIPYSYTVTFENGASAAQGNMDAMTLVYGTAQALAKCNYTRAGYVFIGWSRDATVHENETTEVSPVEFYDEESVKNLTAEKNGSVTLYAKWFAEIKVNYRVEHYQQNLADDGYTLFETETLQGYAMKRTEAAAKSYEGFTPLGFAQTHIIPTYDDAEVAVVRIYYNRNNYEVSYTASESGVTNLPAEKSYRYGTTIKVESDIPVRTGYRFAGWIKDTDTSVLYAYGDTILHDEITDFIKADISMHARWTAITYKIHYSAGSMDRVSGTMADTDATFDAGVSLAAVGFTRDGYVFAGWAKAEGGAKVYSDGESVMNLSATQDAVVTLYALWSEGNSAYTVEHYLQNASGSTVLSDYELKDTETKGGTTGENTAAQAKTTYTGFTAQPFSQATITNDGTTTIKIYYNRNPYTVTFDGNGNTGGATATQTFYYGVEQAIKTNGFTKTGYSFAGWATSASAEKSYGDGDSYTIGAGDETLYAKWAANNYAVALSATDATTAGTASVTATFDSAMPAITTLPKRTGYTFAGFFTGANGGGTQYYSAAGESMRTWDIASDTTLYAHWTEATNTKYKVEHYQQNIDDNDYTLVSADTQDLTGKTGAQTAASAKSYTGFNTPTVTQREIAADGSTMVRIYYTRKTFTVTYTAGDGITSGVSGMPTTPQTYRYGASVTIANEEPTRSGYAFNGWMLGSDTTARWRKGQTVSNAITENLTLTAAWSNATITVVIDNERGNVEAKTTTTDSSYTITLQTAGTYLWKIDSSSSLPSWASVSADTMTLTIDKTAIFSNANFASGTTKNYQIDAVDLSDILSGKDYHQTVSITKP